MSHPRNPHALLTPAMRTLLARMAQANPVPLHAMAPEQAKAAYASRADVLELPSQAMARAEDLRIPARDGHLLDAKLLVPTAAALPVLVYFHGGGFTVGSVATHEILCRRLAHLTGCAVLSLDYRLAPEFKFPTAHNDCWDAVQWLVRHGAEHGLDVDRVAVGGDSAGGTIATACAVQARDAGIELALQLLFYPGTIGHQNSASHRMFGRGFLLEDVAIDYFFGHYLRNPADRDDWRFAPLDGLRPDGQSVDFSGVAPTWIGLAECDPLADEGIAYADALRIAGVAVDLEIYRGVVHEFIKMGRALPQAAQAHADAARALRRAFQLEAQ
ncbi:alpha/beta hydrolase [Rhodoferax sp.]|uniref:alpha/beta hydrolase n=1 Tax=Rhodoferax sp. TaxID=50421 RepID=UPI0037834A3D